MGIAAVPVISSLALWKMAAGHLYGPNLESHFGHGLYGLLVGAIAVSRRHIRRCRHRRHHRTRLYDRFLVLDSPSQGGRDFSIGCHGCP